MAADLRRVQPGAGGTGSRAADGSKGRDPHPGRGRRCAARPSTDFPIPLRLLGGCAPEYIRSDNGPEFIALAVQEWIARRGFKTLYIEPGSPWQNAYSESFNSRFRDEFLNRESFASVLEAKVLGKEHRHRHNQERPHSSLEYQTPEEFAQRSLAAASATLRQPQGCALPTHHITTNLQP